MLPPLRNFSPAQIRSGFKAQMALLPPAPDALEQVQELTAGGRPARLYRPHAQGALPLLLFFHGGGWVVGDLDTHDTLCRRLAARSSCLVLAIDYRLAPEHPFPSAVDDAWDALLWSEMHATELGADPSRIALAGDSAGGNLCAALSLRVRERVGPLLRGQLLLYPVLDRADAKWPSYEQMAMGYGLTRESMFFYWEQYVGSTPAAISPEAAPLLARSHAGLPPTLVFTAEYDVLRDEGEQYAKVLQAAGVDAQLRRYAGMNHGFVSLCGLVEDADRALADAVTWLRERL